MTTAPVSVIIPFYNGHDFISRAIASIDNQTMPPAEIIIVDDGSARALEKRDVTRARALPREASAPDASVSPPAKSESDLRIVTHATNRGIPSARNSGVAGATQPWVAFLDQDDEWLPHKMESQWHAVEATGDRASNTVFYGCAYRPLREDRDDSLISWPRRAVSRRLDRSPRDALRELMLRGNAIPLITVLCATDTLRRVGGFDEQLRGGSDDYAFLMRCAANGVVFRLVNAREPIARRHETGANHSNALRFLRDDCALLSDLARDVPSVQAMLPSALAAAHYRAGRTLLETEPAASRAHLVAALRLRRLYPRAILAAIAASGPSGLRRAITRAWLRARRALYRS